MQGKQEQSSEARRQKIIHSMIFGLLVAAFALLIVDHWVHVMGVAPYLLILACPLMHLFGHRHHGRHDHAKRPEVDKEGN